MNDANTSPKVAEVALVSPSDIVTPLGDRMPEATESAVHSAPVDNPPTNPPSVSAPSSPLAAEGTRDARGNIFNAKRHQVNADGTARKNAKGNFIFRADYKGRAPKKELPPGQTESAGAMNSGPVNPPSFNLDDSGERPVDPNLPPLQDEYELAAEVYLQSAYGPVIICLSEHARPDREDHAALKVALANFLRVKQVKEPSPGWAFALVALAVAVKKSAHPEVRERALSLGERAKKFFGLSKFKAPQIANA